MLNKLLLLLAFAMLASAQTVFHGVRLNCTATAPSTNNGQIWCDSGDSNQVKVRSNGAWVTVGAGGVAVKKTYGASFFNGGSALATATSIPFSIPTSCTVTAWTVSVDAGTATFKVWKVATGTAIPTVSDSINTSGLAISTGTHVRSATLSDFTDTTWTAGDVFRIALTAVATATMANFGVECQE